MAIDFTTDDVVPEEVFQRHCPRCLGNWIDDVVEVNASSRVFRDSGGQIVAIKGCGAIFGWPGEYHCALRAPPARG